MHELGHIAVLILTLCGVASGLLLVLWPVLADRALERSSRALLALLATLGAAALLAEWLVVH